MPTRWKALRFGPLEAAALLSVLAAAAAWAAPRPALRAQIRHEDRADALVRRVATAEWTFRAKKTLDANGDGAFEYGPLDALARAGLLDRPPKSDAQGTFLEESGYRVEVLLPGGAQRGGGVALVRSTGKPDPALAASTFAVVALPGAGAGLRAIYVDAAGRTFEAEGVSDDQGLPARTFPSRAIEHDDDDLKDGTPIWHVPKRPVPFAFDPPAKSKP